MIKRAISLSCVLEKSLPKFLLIKKKQNFYFESYVFSILIMCLLSKNFVLTSIVNQIDISDFKPFVTMAISGSLKSRENYYIFFCRVTTCTKTCWEKAGTSLHLPS